MAGIGERQKDTTDSYRCGWDRIWGRNPKTPWERMDDYNREVANIVGEMAAARSDPEHMRLFYGEFSENRRGGE